MQDSSAQQVKLCSAMHLTQSVASVDGKLVVKSRV